MTKLSSLDVLIVYSESLARSASSSASDQTTPFSLTSSNAAYNTVYGYFLDVCRQLNLTAGFSTSADIIGPGFCKSYWSYRDGVWHKVKSPGHSLLIFDKFSPTRKGIKARRQLLFSSPEIKPFNDPGLFNLFFDKQKTYDHLSGYSIPTVASTGDTLDDVRRDCQALTDLVDSHPGSKDFTADVIMKDRYGAGGRHVYKFSQNQPEKMLSVICKNAHVSFVLQPFAKFDRGFSYRSSFGSTDIRIIYLNGRIVQSYIRVAKTGDFRCNEHQGGLLTYLTSKKLPPALIAKSNTIAKYLNKNCSLFALDFIITNNGNVYLLEGNTGPGLDWNMSLKRNETEAKKLIRMVVSELAVRSGVPPIPAVFSSVSVAPILS